MIVSIIKAYKQAKKNIEMIELSFAVSLKGRSAIQRTMVGFNLIKDTARY